MNLCQDLLETGSTELRTDVFAVRSFALFAVNSANKQTCANSSYCPNRANGSYCANNANNSFFKKRRTRRIVRAGANTVPGACSEIYLRIALERSHSKFHWLPNSWSLDFMMQTYAFDHEVPVVHYQFSIFQFSNGFTGSEIVSIDLNNIFNSVIQKFLNFCSPREFGTTIMANFEVFNSLWKASSGKEWSWFPKWVEFIRLYPVQISENDIDIFHEI